ncbi:hypothetical protein ACXWRW_11850, partial [Streptococcus pyogenes]
PAPFPSLFPLSALFPSLSFALPPFPPPFLLFSSFSFSFSSFPLSFSFSFFLSLPPPPFLPSFFPFFLSPSSFFFFLF